MYQGNGQGDVPRGSTKGMYQGNGKMDKMTTTAVKLAAAVAAAAETIANGRKVVPSGGST